MEMSQLAPTTQNDDCSKSNKALSVEPNCFASNATTLMRMV